MIKMDDIIREGHPTLRKVAKEMTFPLTEEEKKLGKKMMEFLINSQDTETAERYKLRGGVGIAAPQLDVSKRMIAVHIPNENPAENPTPRFSDILINPKVISHSVQEACLADGEGCLSVDREIPGYVVRHLRATITYSDLAGIEHKKRLKDYEAFVIQHEIDHLNGIMFYDHINEANPFGVGPEVKILD